MFRILALDGGGIKGTFTAAVLQQFEEQLGAPLIDRFDLIVGTSTGGIIALGLACGIEASALLSFYVDDGLKVFPRPERGFAGLIRRMFAPKCDSGHLTSILSKYLPDRRFADLGYNVAITSFDAATAQPVVFKTPYHPSLSAHSDLGVIDVARATSAAPTYFEAAKTRCGVMIDGGVWANCPAMVGVTDALSLFRRRIDDICVLSIGTTTIPAFVRRDERQGGLLHWARPAASLLMHASKLGAIEHARKLCKTLIRVDAMVEPDRFEIDDASQVDDLAQLGWNIARRCWKDVESTIFRQGSPPRRRRLAMHGRRAQPTKTRGNKRPPRH